MRGFFYERGNSVGFFIELSCSFLFLARPVFVSHKSELLSCSKTIFLSVN